MRPQLDQPLTPGLKETATKLHACRVHLYQFPVEMSDIVCMSSCENEYPVQDRSVLSCQKLCVCTVAKTNASCTVDQFTDEMSDVVFMFC